MEAKPGSAAQRDTLLSGEEDEAVDGSSIAYDPSVGVAIDQHRSSLDTRLHTPLAAKAPEIEEEPAKQERHNTLYDLLVLEADFGFLPESHPAMQYVQHRMRTLFPDMEENDYPDVKVLARKGFGVNAMAFSNWTVAIAPEMIEFCRDCMEALDNVILHELSHLTSKHHDLIRSSVRGGRIAAAIGSQRYAEMDANMQAFYFASETKRDSNALGAVWLAEKLAAIPENKRNWDLAHGDINKELIQYSLTLRFLELFVEKPLRPLPEGIADSVAHLPQERRASHLMQHPPMDVQDWEWWKQIAQIHIHDADLPLLQIVSPPLITRFRKYMEIAAKERTITENQNALRSTQHMIHETLALLTVIMDRWNQIMQEKWAHSSPQENIVGQALQVEMGLGLPVLTESHDAVTRMLMEKQRFGQEFRRYEEKQTSEENSLARLPTACAAIAFPFPKGSLLRTVVQTALRCLGEHMAFVDRESNDGSQYKIFLRQAATALKTAAQTEERWGVETQEPWGTQSQRSGGSTKDLRSTVHGQISC